MADSTPSQTKSNPLNLDNTGTGSKGKNKNKNKNKNNKGSTENGLGQGQASISSASGTSGISPTTETSDGTSSTHVAGTTLTDHTNISPTTSEHDKIASAHAETEQVQVAHPTIKGLSLLGPMRQHSEFDGAMLQDQNGNDEVTVEFVKGVQRDEAKKIIALRAYTARVQKAWLAKEREKFKGGEVVKAWIFISGDEDGEEEGGKKKKKSGGVKYVDTKVALEDRVNGVFPELQIEGEKERKGEKVVYIGPGIKMSKMKLLNGAGGSGAGETE